jgi:Flp pilus assembly secretin CpaC
LGVARVRGNAGTGLDRMTKRGLLMYYKLKLIVTPIVWCISCAIIIGFTACSSSEPKVIQATSDSPLIRLAVGMATEIEVPADSRVRSVAVGNPSMVTATNSSDVVNLISTGKIGETNLIIRCADSDGQIKVYQYRIVIER